MKCDDPIFLWYGGEKDDRNYLKNHSAQNFEEETTWKKECESK